MVIVFLMKFNMRRSPNFLAILVFLCVIVSAVVSLNLQDLDLKE